MSACELMSASYLGYQRRVEPMSLPGTELPTFVLRRFGNVRVQQLKRDVVQASLVSRPATYRGWENQLFSQPLLSRRYRRGAAWGCVGFGPGGDPPARVCPRIAINMPLTPSPPLPTWTFGTNFCALARAAVKTSGCALANLAMVSSINSNWRNFTVDSGPSTPPASAGLLR